MTEMSDEQILMQYLVVNRSSSQAAALGEAAVAALKASGDAIILFPQEAVSPCHCEGAKRLKQSRMVSKRLRLPRSRRSLAMARADDDTVSAGERVLWNRIYLQAFCLSR